MDERKEEDDVVADTAKPHRSKVHYYSQPLPQPPASAAKRNAVRKHSLDDVFASADDTDSSNAGSGRSLSYPHYNTHLPPHLLPRNPSCDGTLTLERAMSEFGGAPGTLPEFVGAGGGSGIFRVPLRAAMHPARPPALELRPHPLRETQYGAFLRTVASTDTQLWAGQESGLRFWTLGDVFDGCAGKKGDEESAVFRESPKGRTSPVLCMVVDAATGVIWSGHKDGKIRSWRIGGEGEENVGWDEGGRDGGVVFREGLSWQAHRHPVLSMTISSYGEICFPIIVKRNIPVQYFI